MSLKFIYIIILLTFIVESISDSCSLGSYRSQLGPWNSCAGFRTCEKGSYCAANEKHICPGGTFGNAEGLTTANCSGLCPQGYYCPVGTIIPSSYRCGRSDVYCPLGSELPKKVPVGYYGISTSEEASYDIAICPKGYFCTDGIKSLCAPGLFGVTEGLSSPQCSGPCPAGWYCPIGSVYPIPCSQSAREYCPIGSPHPLQTPPGYYVYGESFTLGGGYHAIIICPLGTFCDQGRQIKCAPGTYGAIEGSYNSSCSGFCAPGFYCPAGSIMSKQNKCGNSSVYCPGGQSYGSGSPITVSLGFYTIGGLEDTEDSSGNNEHGLTRSGQLQCEPGYYCLADGIRRPCPAGWYGATAGLSASFCSGLCDPGFYCPAASSSPTQLMCGSSAVFCPAGSPVPEIAHMGYYTVGGNESTRFAQMKCEPGSYCVDGVRILCQPGTYGITYGLTHFNCTGPCSPGYYCPEGSVISTEMECGDASRYCPEGVPHPLNVPGGSYSIGGNESTRVSYSLAPRGYYAANGILYGCPAGRYGALMGLTTSECSGDCAEGFFCPEASVSPFMFGCGPQNVYCPARSTAPVEVLVGRYTVDWSEPCGAGYYRNFSLSKDATLPGHSVVPTRRLTPVCQPCPGNTYKSVRGDSFRLCRPCNSYATAASGQATCVCYGITGGSTTDMNSGHVLYFNVTENRCDAVTLTDFLVITQDYLHDYNSRHMSRIPSDFFGSGTGPNQIRPDPEHFQSPSITVTYHYQTDCEPGYYCESGIRSPCPAGTYTSLSRETRPLCEGQCAPGFYCPPGSVSARQVPCGGPQLYCPIGSGLPLVVPPGYYSDLSSAGPTERFSILVCPLGHWCIDGLMHPCPAGTFGELTGLSTAACSGLCHAGHYCPEASTKWKEHPCGGSAVYCPRGSPAPLTVHGGFYGANSGAGAGGSYLWDKANTTFSVELPCEPGYYCIGGIKYPCAPGRFNWRYGMNSSDCAGLCAKGYYCPSYLTPQPEAPPSTVWPRKPHTRADDLECGAVDLFCPAGSSLPQRVKGGWYTYGGDYDNRTRWEQWPCPQGSFCNGGIKLSCPRGRYGNETGLNTYVCSGVCPPSFFCPENTASPLPCPALTYSVGGQWACSPCPGLQALANLTLPCQDQPSCCARAATSFDL